MRSLFVLLVFVILAGRASAQCCSAGSPVGGDGSSDGLSRNELRIFGSYKYSLSKKYYYHDSRTDLNYIDRSYYDYASISATYGIWPFLSAHAELGYFIDKTQFANVGGGQEKIKASGLGDLAINLRFVPYRTVKPVSQLVISGGVKIPVGAFHEEINGAMVPISLQPSSGAMKYNAGVFYSRKKAGQRFGWSVLSMFEYSQTIRNGFLIYQYGNYFQLAGAASYTATKDFTIIANAKIEVRGHDRRENNARVDATGSYVFYFNPQLIYNLPHRWGLIVMADIPVYKYVNGYQLTNCFSIQGGLRKSFLFCRKVKASEPTALNTRWQ